MIDIWHLLSLANLSRKCQYFELIDSNQIGIPFLWKIDKTELMSFPILVQFSSLCFLCKWSFIFLTEILVLLSTLFMFLVFGGRMAVISSLIYLWKVSFKSITSTEMTTRYRIILCNDATSLRILYQNTCFVPYGWPINST